MLIILDAMELPDGSLLISTLHIAPIEDRDEVIEVECGEEWS